MKFVVIDAEGEIVGRFKDETEAVEFAKKEALDMDSEHLPLRVFQVLYEVAIAPVVTYKLNDGDDSE